MFTIWFMWCFYYFAKCGLTIINIQRNIESGIILIFPHAFYSRLPSMVYIELFSWREWCSSIEIRCAGIDSIINIHWFRSPRKYLCIGRALMCDNKLICSLVSVKRCSVRCKYGSCTCKVTRYSYDYHHSSCNVCCCCECDRRGFANCYEYFNYQSRRYKATGKSWFGLWLLITENGHVENIEFGRVVLINKSVSSNISLYFAYIMFNATIVSWGNFR